MLNVTGDDNSGGPPNLNAGARVVATAPVQVMVFSGDIGSYYESRDSALLPIASWASSYYTPVSTPSSVTWDGSTYSTVNTSVFLYNPDTDDITVTYARRSNGNITTSNINVPGGSVVRQLITQNPAGTGTGAHFYTTGALFYAYSITDSNNATYTTRPTQYNGNQAWDWSFTLIPESSLTTQALIGLGIGRDPNSTLYPNETTIRLWVTRVGPTGTENNSIPVYVDYDGDPATGALTNPLSNKYDVAYNLRAARPQNTYDPTDRDQPGLLVYTLPVSGNYYKLAVAWGQDPTAAHPGEPGLDVGTSVPPMPEFSPGKENSLEVDNDGDGYVSPGDVLTYTITVYNISRLPVPNVIIRDTIPTGCTYVANSTYKGATLIPDNTGTGRTPFPLDNDGYTDGYNVGTLLKDGSVTVTFRALIGSYSSLGGRTAILNGGSGAALNITLPVNDTAKLRGWIEDYVWLDTDHDGIQDAGEGGVPGVTVRLLDSDRAAVLNDVGVAITAVTDSQGKYRFTGLYGDSYIVEFDPPDTPGYNFTLPLQGTNRTVDSNVTDDHTTSGARTALFTLGSGEHNVTIDCGLWDAFPTLAVVSSFTASVSQGRVVASWQTASESGTAGFYLERLDAKSGKWVRINRQLVPALFESHRRLLQLGGQWRPAQCESHLPPGRGRDVGHAAFLRALQGDRLESSHRRSGICRDCRGC